MTTTYQLYNETIELRYVTKGRSHWYEYDGEKLPNVTKISDMCEDSSGALIYWAVDEALKKIKSELPVGEVLDEIQVEEIVEKGRWAHRETSNKALAIGSEVHNWIEKHINLQIEGNKKGNKSNMPINSQVKEGVIAFLDWEKQNKVKYFSSERRIMSLEYKYAGTMDIEAEVNGELGIQDIKTSKAIYPGYHVQVAAYRKAIEEETGEEYPNCNIIRVPKDGGEIEIEPLVDYEVCWTAFYHALNLYNQMEKFKEIRRNI